MPRPATARPPLRQVARDSYVALSGDVVAAERITGPILDTGCSILDAVTVAATAKQTSVGHGSFPVDSTGSPQVACFFVKLVLPRNTCKRAVSVY